MSSEASAEESTNQANFKKFKAICVPLLATSRLSKNNVGSITALLTELNRLLNEISSEHLTSNLIPYIFLPLSTILQRNPSAEIPDQVLEKVLVAFGRLAESWWWTCEVKVWEQMFMLCGAVIGGIEGKVASKGKSRDDETKEAAARCLLALTRPRSPEEAQRRNLLPAEAKDRLLELQEHTNSERFMPIIGQSVDSVLATTESQHIPLQRISLEVMFFFIDIYLPDHLIPSVLPGVVSKMIKVCLGVSGGKGWANGEVIARALKVMEIIVIKAIGDEVCIQSGAVRRFSDLEDLVNLHEPMEDLAKDDNTKTYGTRRTQSWLRGTATQLHIAINSLTTLVSHPTPSAILALAHFSGAVLGSTSLTLPQTQPLLLSFLLSLSLSDYPSVLSESRRLLIDLLTRPSDAQLALQQTLMVNLGDNLSALPRLLSTQADAQVSHAAGLIEAVCRLASTRNSQTPVPAVSKGVGKLLGPTGGIEKWGWSLLSVLEFVEPPIVVTHTSGAQLTLENNPDLEEWISFPELVFKNISSHNTREALEKMFQALGSAGRDNCLFAVEWFTNVGRSGTSPSSVAALWCAGKLLEGIADISIVEGRMTTTSDCRPSGRLEKHARALARTVAEIWDKPDFDFTASKQATVNEDDSSFSVQYQKGLVPLHESLKIGNAQSKVPVKSHQPIIHRALCLQLIAVAAGVVQARFSSLFIHILYPILHSLVSSVSFLSSTALATLNFVTIVTSHASPANLLLSNFDYVLDSVSRRLTQRWLDIDATKVLSVMIRLVGADVVEKAGDVVEECFDRLDEFHGYGLIVDGLIEVLIEVLKVVELEARTKPSPKTDTSASPPLDPRKSNLDDFFACLPHRFEEDTTQQDNATDFGPAPREAWGQKDLAEEERPDDDGPVEAIQNDEPPPTPVQALTTQIVSRSMYFLTHDSPVIRARILNVLALSVPVLPESALLPSIHSAWPFILNRLRDSETFVCSAAAGLVEELATHVGDFMFRRIWDDVWPIFRSLLRALEVGDATNALTRRDKTRIGTESAYTHSHRLYRSILKTMTAAVKSVSQHEVSFWQVLVAFRRFLASQAHEDLQDNATKLYTQAGKSNPDAVWLVLTSTTSETDPVMRFMSESQWDIIGNAERVLKAL
ncbi:armadillo-type protein [Crassisporium funariophilum]|nr:armadillo-type protein [Crassisporium funariophilum]